MKLTTSVLLLASSLLATSGVACGPRRVVVVHEEGTPQPVQGQDDEAEEQGAEDAPPADVVETQPPSPGPTYVWIVGRHRWVGGRWVWYGGRWVGGRPGHVWERGRWERRGRVHVYVGGHWRR